MRLEYVDRVTWRVVWKERKTELICGLLCLAVIVSLTRVLIRRSLYIETNNAAFQGYSIAISSEVEGEVLRVFVKENEEVKKGQLLCLLEDSHWLAKANEAEAEFAALKTQWENAQRDERRSAELLRQSTTSPQSYDQARARANSLHARMQAAKDEARLARINLNRTRVSAPDDGMIAFRTASPGMLAQPGTPLFGFVAKNDRWVLARVRETDLSDLHVGKPVNVTFDAVPGRDFVGKIESIGPATERPFYAAIPEDFSAGNYTKYVQWHPIRIKLKLSQAEQTRMPVGISSFVHMTRD